MSEERTGLGAVDSNVIEFCAGSSLHQNNGSLLREDYASKDAFRHDADLILDALKEALRLSEMLCSRVERWARL